MAATLATATTILKEIYEPRLQKQLQNYQRTAKRIEQTSEGVGHDIGGKYVKFALHVKRNHGIGSRLEMEQLPDAGNQGYATAQVGLSYQYGQIRLSGQAMELAEKNYQSFASLLDQEITGVRDDLGKDFNRQIYGTSAGVLMTSSGTYANNTIPSSNTQYMEEGMIVDVYNSTGDTLKASGRVVTAVNAGSNIIVDGAAIATGAAGDIVVRKGNLNKEIVGLSQIINDTNTLFGVNPSVTPQWKSVVNGNGGVNRPLNESLMIKMVDDIYTNGGDTTAIFTTLGVRRAYYNLLTQQRRYSNVQEYDGGFKGLGFMTDNGDVPLVTDPDCQPNRMYFVNEKKLKIYREKDWGFMDRDGSKWHRVPSYDAYDATLYKYHQLGTHRRNTHGLIQDVTEA